MERAGVGPGELPWVGPPGRSCSTNHPFDTITCLCIQIVLR